LCLIATIYGTIWRYNNIETTASYLDLRGTGHSVFDNNWFLNAL
jgi:hypothetical protein